MKKKGNGKGGSFSFGPFYEYAAAQYDTPSSSCNLLFLFHSFSSACFVLPIPEI